MYYKHQDIKLYYEKYGNNKENKILILPGWGNTRQTFYNLINQFKEYYEIYIVDYPGFGKTKFPNKNLTIYDYTEVIIDMIKDLKINNPIIIAHSFGGRISILLNSFYNIQIDRMIFIDTAGIKPKRTITGIFKTLLYKFLKKLKVFLPKKYKKLYLKKLLNKFGSTDYNAIPDTMKNTFKNIVNEDLKMYLPKMKSEVLLIYGENDLDTPLKDAKIMHKKIKNSYLIIIPGCGHFSYIEQSYTIYKIIYEYLKNC